MFKVVDEADAIEPCKECEKTLRGDVEGYCLDCADENGISEIFPEEERKMNRLRLQSEGILSRREKKANLRRMKILILLNQNKQIKDVVEDRIDELPEQEQAPFKYLLSQCMQMKEARIEMLTNDLGLPFEEADRIFEKFSRLLDSIGIFDHRDFEEEEIVTIAKDPNVAPWVRKLRWVVSSVAGIWGYRLLTKEETARHDVIQEKQSQLEEKRKRIRKEKSKRFYNMVLIAVGVFFFILIAISLT